MTGGAFRDCCRLGYGALMILLAREWMKQIWKGAECTGRSETLIVPDPTVRQQREQVWRAVKEGLVWPRKGASWT